MIWANSPVVKGNMIFLSIGYNYPAKMLKVNDDVSSLEEVYTNIAPGQPPPRAHRIGWLPVWILLDKQRHRGLGLPGLEHGRSDVR